jgi:exosome complex exonuclease RRP6
MDIIWLQRDLGLYVVGLFDTFYACDALGYAGKSLAFLLKKFVDFDADKKYQLADWRIRPLPDEMFYYARSDTHYLLYIYDMLRNELATLSAQGNADGNPIDYVLQKSKEVSLQRYEHPLCDSETGAGNRGWFNTLVKSSALYNGEQFAVYRAVHKWRDDVARREDESPVFIMTQQVLSNIARIMPTDPKALWSLLDSNAKVLKTRLDELFQVIQEARARGVNGPTMLEFFRQTSTGAAPTELGNQPKPSTKVEVEQLSIDELKSTHSQLWGSVALNSTLDGTSKARPIDSQEMIPLYSFDLSAFKEELPLPAAPAPAPKKQPEEEPVIEDEGFTLKAGRKRKASEAAEAEPESDAEMDLSPAADQPDSPEADEPETSEVSEGEEDDGEAENAVPASKKQHQPKYVSKEAKKAARKEFKRVQREAKKLREAGDANAAKELLADAKRARKAARRAEKKLLEQQQQQQQQTSTSASAAASPSGADAAEEQASSPDAQQEEQDQPFDYTKAASVLHAAKEPNGTGAAATADGKGKGKKGKKGKTVPFDPYAKKAGDAPQGARKMNYERAGRSATFKK